MASAGTPRSGAAEAAAVLAAFKQSAADTQAFHAANPPHDARLDARTGPRGPRGSGSPCGCALAEGRSRADRASCRDQSGRRHLRHRRHGPRGRRSLSARARLSSAAAARSARPPYCPRGRRKVRAAAVLSARPPHGPRGRSKLSTAPIRCRADRHDFARRICPPRPPRSPWVLLLRPD